MITDLGVAAELLALFREVYGRACTGHVLDLCHPTERNHTAETVQEAYNLVYRAGCAVNLPMEGYWAPSAEQWVWLNQNPRLYKKTCRSGVEACTKLGLVTLTQEQFAELTQ